MLYQVALVVAGDEGVSGGSGGRLSGQSGQRSRKVYSPPARIFRRLARADVVGVVAQVWDAGRGVVGAKARGHAQAAPAHPDHTSCGVGLVAGGVVGVVVWNGVLKWLWGSCGCVRGFV